ncbi:MinD/ParA family protein [Bacillus sp. SM2101]|uniref:MinD/ParA family protein n=1 Tax=Bacillus sp. SM2101 TaxID=2805366 RepID=UPI001BDE2FB5|nr:MinD/ParA family protein [Bacillus sp. SM2101]
MVKDQAASLREQMELQGTNTSAKTIAVISGKGGVGKSNISLNFALTLARQKKKVLIFDMDIGMGNIDILMGVSSKYTILDVFNNEISIDQIITKGPENLSYIAGGSGFNHVFKLDSTKVHLIIQHMQRLIDKYDYVIFDMGAGMTEENLLLLKAVNEVFVVTTPEPTSIMDAYAAIKYIILKDPAKPLFLIINKTQSQLEGNHTTHRISTVMKQFLNKEIKVLGQIPEDKHIVKAVSRQTPFLLYAPKSSASKNIQVIANTYLLNSNDMRQQKPTTHSFMSRLRKYLIER